jgi:pilus assembly protein Flp/PilA
MEGAAVHVIERKMENMQVEKKLEKNDKKEKGASLVEYALLVALIAVVAIAGVKAIGGSVSSQFLNIQNSISR